MVRSILSDDAVARIVGAVGLDASNIDRKLLADELNKEVHICHFLYLVGKPANARKLEAIYKAAKRLKSLIAYDRKDPTFLHIASIEGGLHGLRKPLDSLLATIEGTRLLSAPLAKLTIVFDSLGSRSELEILVGLGLARVYRLVFKRRPTLRRRADQQAYGPYLDFAHQSLIELGITRKGRPYSRETIVRALSAVRSGQRRGKKKPAILNNS